MAPRLPPTYKRLVAKRTGKSFRDVAEVEETPLPQPGPNEVRLCSTGSRGSLAPWQPVLHKAVHMPHIALLSSV